MDSGDIVGLSIFAFALLFAFLFSLASSALALVDREQGQKQAYPSRILDRWIGQILKWPGPAFSALTVKRYFFSAVALTSVTYLLGSEGRSYWLPLSGGLLALVGLLKLIPHLAYQVAHRLSYSKLRLLALWAAPTMWLAGTIAVTLKRFPKPLPIPSINGDTRPSDTPHSIVIPMEEAGTPPDERDLLMIRGILNLEQSTAREIMIPRVDLVAVSANDPLSRATNLMVASGHRRLLVYEENVDRVLGILHSRDLLPLVGQPNPSETLRDLVRPAVFIPENKHIDELLREFLHQRVHMAVVVDEYGGTAGLVTLSDLMEEIVGEIADEFHYGDPDVQIISSEEVVLEARVNLSYLEGHFGIRIDAEGFDTVGGLVYSGLGRVPTAGDEVVANGLRLHVLNTVGKRIKRVRVTLVSEMKSAAKRRGV